MAFPDMTRLPMRAPVSTPAPKDETMAQARDEWLAAIGESRPPFKLWKSFNAQEKWRLVHQVAQRSQTADNDYVTPYTQSDIDDVLKEGRWSVEHVLPRSKCQMAESDPWNFIEADRQENSMRSNLPLKLWPDKPNQLHLCTIQPWDGELHYAPPPNQRARLARKWLYACATYNCGGTMSRAQREHLTSIIALAKFTPPSLIEINVAVQLEKLTGTRNPLILDAAPSRWYDSSAWRALVGGL